MRDPYEELASAIVAKGIQDYYTSAKKMVASAITYLVNGNVGKGTRLFDSFANNRRLYLECKIFLLSDWYMALSVTDGKVVKEKLDAKVSSYGSERLFRETHKTISKH